VTQEDRDGTAAVFSGFELPPDFLFGVSNAAFQVEGGYNRCGGPRNNWAQWERAGKVEPTLEACRFWDDYAEHIDKAASLGLNGFRMSLEWARLQPTTSEGKAAPPPWDEKALDRYAEIVGAVMAAGMEPVITLHHFTHPAWCGVDFWLEDDSARMLAAYAVKAADEVNQRLEKSGRRPIKLWVTLNEPNLLGPLAYFLGEHPHEKKGLTAARLAAENLIIAQVLSYNALHDLYRERGWDSPLVSTTTYCACFYNLDRAVLDILRAPSLGVDRTELHDYLLARAQDWDRTFLDMAAGRFGRRSPQTWYYRLINHVYSRLSGVTHMRRAMDAVYDSPRQQLFDYLGLDIYDPFTGAYPPKLPTPRRIREKEPILRVPLWENVYEAGEFALVIRAHARDSGGIPVYVMENGMCHRQKKGERPRRRSDGLTRDIFLKRMLGEIVGGIKEGLPLKGYFYWSLTDNYEWGSYEPRFGLHEYDFGAGRILERDGLGTVAGEVYSGLIKALRSGDEALIRKAFDLP